MSVFLSGSTPSLLFLLNYNPKLVIRLESLIFCETEPGFIIYHIFEFSLVVEILVSKG